MAKVNQYVIVRDLGRGASAEVKLCRLLEPARKSNSGKRVSVGDGKTSGGGAPFWENGARNLDNLGEWSGRSEESAHSVEGKLYVSGPFPPHFFFRTGLNLRAD